MRLDFSNIQEFRKDESVDLAEIDDDPGNYFLGWNGSGEWLRYSVNVLYDGEIN